MGSEAGFARCVRQGWPAAIDAGILAGGAWVGLIDRRRSAGSGVKGEDVGGRGLVMRPGRRRQGLRRVEPFRQHRRKVPLPPGGPLGIGIDVSTAVTASVMRLARLRIRPIGRGTGLARIGVRAHRRPRRPGSARRVGPQGRGRLVGGKARFDPRFIGRRGFAIATGRAGRRSDSRMVGSLVPSRPLGRR